jgi:hypothetical protein
MARNWAQVADGELRKAGQIPLGAGRSFWIQRALRPRSTRHDLEGSNGLVEGSREGSYAEGGAGVNRVCWPLPRGSTTGSLQARAPTEERYSGSGVLLPSCIAVCSEARDSSSALREMRAEEFNDRSVQLLMESRAIEPRYAGVADLRGKKHSVTSCWDDVRFS